MLNNLNRIHLHNSHMSCDSAYPCSLQCFLAQSSTVLCPMSVGQTWRRKRDEALGYVSGLCYISVLLFGIIYLGHPKPTKTLFGVPKNRGFEGENLGFSWFWVLQVRNVVLSCEPSFSTRAEEIKMVFSQLP